MSIQFAFPEGQMALWAALGVASMALLIWALRRFEKRRAARFARFIEAGLSPRLLPGYDARVRRPLFWLTAAGTCALLLAAAQPHWGQAWVQMKKGSRDILVLLDTSESMNAQNPAPNRLERARLKIESLMDLCPADRFGLIAFAGDAAMQCPLTLDHNYLRTVLRSIDTDTMTEEGTDIAAALKEADSALEEDIAKSGEETRYSRAILLITDGEQVAGDAIKAARDMGRYAGIFVMGIGDPEGAEVTYPEWMKRYAPTQGSREAHLSKLDEKTLMQVATDSGGVYVRSRADSADVDRIAQELEAMRTHAVSGDLRFNLVNRYRWPLSVAVACFAAEGLWVAAMPWLRRRRLRRLEA